MVSLGTLLFARLRWVAVPLQLGKPVTGVLMVVELDMLTDLTVLTGLVALFR
jgi:hypothetical protein